MECTILIIDDDLWSKTELVKLITHYAKSDHYDLNIVWAYPWNCVELAENHKPNLVIVSGKTFLDSEKIILGLQVNGQKIIGWSVISSFSENLKSCGINDFIDIYENKSEDVWGAIKGFIEHT